MKFRRAERKDVVAIVEMIADDKLGKLRERFEDPLPDSYVRAFNRIDSDPNQELVVVEDEEGKVIGTLQLTFIPYLSHKGSWRCLIESVRVGSAWRGQGYGTRVFEWAIDRARGRGCQLVQLTSDKQRPEAIRFYERLGFVASHEGLKLKLA